MALTRRGNIWYIDIKYKDPLGLVNTIVDPSDWRRRLYFLSSEGRELYQRITGEEPDMPSV